MSTKSKRKKFSNSLSRQMERTGASSSYGGMDYVQPEYQVFLCFRRPPGTRSVFFDHLHESMIRAGIHVFCEDKDRLFPEESGEAVNQAIDNSRIFMPVFSTNYASSVQWLQELSTMVDLCRNAAAEKSILPIFYDLDPHEVQISSGLYWKALDEHKGKYGNKTVQKWEEALIKVSLMPCWRLKEIPGMGLLIKKVVQDVLHKLKFRNRRLPVHLPGMEDQVDDIMRLLSGGSPGIRCVVVHGARGVGKTTLARILFNKHFTQFDKCSFISKVREFPLSKWGILKLRNKLILGPKDTSLTSYEKAFTSARDEIDMMKAKRILIVLDDLDNEDELYKLLGNCQWLGPETRIIITTTNGSIGDGLMIPAVVSTYEMKALADDHAIQLLSRHTLFNPGYARDNRKRARSWIIPEDAFALRRSSRFFSAMDTPEIYGLTDEHRLSPKDFRGMTLWSRIQNQDINIGEGPSSSHSAQTDPNNDFNWEVEMEEGGEGSLVAHEKIQLAAGELPSILKSRVEAVVELMIVDSHSVGIIGICGSDGYGKTTLAKAVCSEVSSQFDAFCFLEDIRETMLLSQGNRSLQNKLTRDTWKGDCVEGSPPSTTRFDEMELPHTKVLIVLDDIKDFSHMKELIGDKLSSRFGRGSRIIITTGGNHVDVENIGADWVTIYHASEMDMESALQIFSQRAFGQDFPLPDHHGIAKTIVKGLKMCPLLIEIAGSLLRGKRFGEFQKMSRLIEPLAHGLQDIIRISYDALDDLQKQIFLDIACFVSGEDVRTAAYMWHDCRHKYPDQILVPHAKVGKDNRLWMHSFVRRLGREIVRTEGSVVPSGMRNRVFANGEEIHAVINRKVTANVEPLCLKFGDQPSDVLNGLNKEASVKLTAENFKNVTRLRFLDLDSSAIVNDFSDVFSTLRWLRWQKCPKEFEATNVKMESLVILDLSGSAVTENWGGWKTIHMTNLKVLNLSHCTGLVATPPLNGLLKLERLILEGCSQLVNVDSSIGILKCLMFLNLKFCRRLRKLPTELGKLEALRELLVDGTRVEEIPEIDKLGKLEVLSSADSTLLGCIPDSIGGLKNLRALTLRGCRRIPKMPDNMEGLGSSLVELDISGTGVLELPSSIASLGSLKVLGLESCHVTELPSFIGSVLKLEEIHASCCRNLKDISSEIGKLSQMRILELRYASISSLPKSIKNLDKLEVLDLLHCDKVEKLPKLPACLKLLKVNPELQQEIQFA